jgi:hypothetical protein
MFDNDRRGLHAVFAAVALSTLAASATGCGSGGGGGAEADPGASIVTPTLAASFVGSGTASTQNLVRTSGAPAGELVTVGVVIGGPTTSADLYSFAFDLVIGDPTVASYVAGSASTGTALTPSSGQSLMVLAEQHADRVTVGVTKLGGGAGNGVAGSGETAVVFLVFRLLRAGTTTLTLAGSPGSAPAALDSGGEAIPSVTFDVSSATLVGI